MAILKVPVVIDGVKSIEELANRVLDEYEYHGRTIREWADRLANPKTKADLIRAMTDDELVNHICCPYGQCINLDRPCNECVLDWLKSQVEEGE